MARIRKGKIFAQLEEDRRLDKVVEALEGKVDFGNWNGSENETAEIVVAIIKEWGHNEGMSIDEVTRRFHQVLIAGILQVAQQRGELEMACDSYGRRFYRSI